MDVFTMIRLQVQGLEEATCTIDGKLSLDELNEIIEDAESLLVFAKFGAAMVARLNTP